MPMVQTATLDTTIPGPYDSTSTVWNIVGNLYSMDNLTGQHMNVHIADAYRPTMDGVFDDVVLHGLYSTSSVRMESTLASVFNFVDGAVVGSDDMAQFHMYRGTVGVNGTLTFDGKVYLQSMIFYNPAVDATYPADIDLMFTQSDSVERSSFLGAQTYGDVTTDEFTFLSFSGIQYGTLNLQGGGSVTYSTIGGLIDLEGTDTLTFNRLVTLRNLAGDGDATSLVLLGDGDANTVVMYDGSSGISLTGRIDMGNGWDTLALHGTINGDIALGQGNDTLVLTGNVTSKITGGKGNDNIDVSGTTIADITVFGGSGADDITGSSFNDVLKGDGGNDTITGGAGRDTLVGGRGSDTFIFNADDSTRTVRDTIRDFKNAQGDQIDLSSFAQFFNATGVFSNFIGEVIVTGRTVKVDLDGDGSADFFLNVRSDQALTVSDFILAES